MIDDDDVDDLMESMLTGRKRPLENLLTTSRSHGIKQPITLVEEDGRFLVVAPPSAREELNECEAVNYLARTRQWECSSTPIAALRLMQRFDVRNYTTRFQVLAEHGRRIALGIPLPEDDHDELHHLGASTTEPHWIHQRRVRLWLEAILQPAGSGAGLWYGIGTGKTRITLDLIRTKGWRRVLVVAPISVLPHWEKQCERFYPGIFNTVVLDTGSTPRRSKRAWDAIVFGDDRPTLIVVNYQIAWRDDFASVIRRAQFDLCVADEGHRLRGRQTRQSLFFRRIWRYVPYRLLLTGSLIANGKLTDAFGPLGYLDPGLFGLSITRFENQYAWKHPDRPFVVKWRNVPRFNTVLWSVIQHQDRSVLDLPPTVEAERTYTMSGEVAAAYQRMKEEFVLELEDGKVTAANAGVKLMKLRQITSGWILDNSKPPKVIRLHDRKRELLEDIITENGDDPLVVFCSFTEDLAQVREACNRCGHLYRELSGRINELSDWQGGGGVVLGVQIQAGSEGIDLTRTSVAVFYSSPHSLLDNEQSRGRVHRPGQRKTTTFISLIAERSVDRAIQAAVAAKKDLVDYVLTHGRKVL
jgi:Mesyanzhinovviridae DNA helicase